MSLEKHDPQALQDLGLASVQIVHDLKNQLNGLKLYATFLRKRFGAGDRPAEELDAVAMLIAGLDRAAAEVSILGRFGRPIELQTRPSVPVDKVMISLLKGEGANDNVELEIEDAALVGEFDSIALTEALKAITDGAINMRKNGNPLKIHLARDKTSNSPRVLIEWRDVKTSGTDVFRTIRSGDGLRMAQAARIIAAHKGTTEQEADLLRVSLPIQ